MATDKQTNTPSPVAPTLSARAYGLVGFLMLLNVLNFVDRQLLASFANFIKPELQLSDTEYGLLTGFAFIVFYSVMGLLAGALADRWHRPRLIAIGVGLWSLLTAASGAAQNFAHLLVARMFIGVGESTMTPTSMSLLADRFPSDKLGFAAGFYYIGVPLGVGVSLLIAGYLGESIGWRNCFYILGGIGITLALCALLISDKDRSRAKSQKAQADVAEAAGAVDTTQRQQGIVRPLFAALRASPALVMTMAGGVTFHFILGASNFDQLWFVQERGYNRADIAVISGWIFCFFGILGNYAGGTLSDWWQRRFDSGRPMFLFWLSLILLPLNLVYRLIDPQASELLQMLFWVCMAVGAFQLGAFYGPTFSTVQELAPAGIRATVVAFYLLMLNLVGLGIGTTIAGVLVDYLRANGSENPYTIMLFGITVLSAVSILLYYQSGKLFKRDRKQLVGHA